MSEQVGVTQPEQVSSYFIEGNDGQRYPAKFLSVDSSFGQVPESQISKLSGEIMGVAKRSFTHWTDDGARFARVLAEKANRVSVVYDPKAENIVALNVYEEGSLEGVNGSIKFVYTHYAGVDPQPGVSGEQYRGQGLMEKSRTNDTRTMNPDAISGCTANGAILRGVRATAKELDRVMYPEVGKDVPSAVWSIGKAIYTIVNGDAAGQSIDTALIRHGDSEYLRGSAPDPIVDSLPTKNDAVLYTSISKACAARIGATS